MLDLMTVREVAEVLKVSRIYSQRSEGHPFFAGKGVAVGRHVRYRREDVIAYIEECVNAN